MPIMNADKNNGSDGHVQNNQQKIAIHQQIVWYCGQ